MRLGLCLLTAILSGCAHVASLTDIQQDTLADGQELCDLVRANYAYLDKRQPGWDAACRRLPDQVGQVSTRPEQLRVLETLTDALHDPHITFGTNSSISPRLVPSGADYSLEEDRVIAVRAGSAAAQAGLAVGDQIVSVNGRTLGDALRSRLQPPDTAASEAQRNWALNAAAAGYRDEPRSATILRDGQSHELTLEGRAVVPPESPLTARMIDGAVGYIRLNDSLGETSTVAAFDAAMDSLRGARFWILDLRDTPGGGSTDIAEPILGRFLSDSAAYQRIRPTDGPEWVKVAEPHGDWTAEGPVAVLVGRWTGSMGEGLAVGFDGAGRGDVFGSDMARLAGGVETFTLSRTGYPIRIPTYDLAHLNGTPRHVWSPPHNVLADNGDGPDLALQAALDWFAEFENPAVRSGGLR